MNKRSRFRVRETAKFCIRERSVLYKRCGCEPQLFHRKCRCTEDYCRSNVGESECHREVLFSLYPRTQSSLHRGLSTHRICTLRMRTIHVGVSSPPLGCSASLM